jgi:hypothetical protein
LRHRETSAERSVRARYLVAADGSRSSLRERLGIPLRGHGIFSNSITIYFRADIRPLVGDRNLSVIYVFGPRLQGFFRFSKAADAGFLVVNKAMNQHGELSADLWQDASDERCVELVREALGAPDLEVELENVQRWNSCADWADRFREGRVFVAGDAAHNMPPTGGFGGNCGVQDAHNLAWKLAYVLQGRAGAGLLDSYDEERRPVGEHTVEQAYTRYVLRLAPELGKENLEPIVPEYAVELGYRYRSACVVPDGGEVDDGGVFENPHEPSGRPGTRAPHLELRRDGSAVSPHDLVGRSFVLLSGSEGDAWCHAGRAAASGLDVPLDAFRVGPDLEDDGGGFEALYGVGRTGAVLLRPDGIIGWRSRDRNDDPEPALRDVLLRLLARAA